MNAKLRILTERIVHDFKFSKYVDEIIYTIAGDEARSAANGNKSR